MRHFVYVASLARVTPVLVAGVSAVALITGCGSSADGSVSSSAPASASGSLDIGVPSESPAPAESPTPAASSESAAPSPSATTSDDPAYTLADAIVDQLGTTPPDRLSDELVTIAVSPQLRQVAASYDVTTGIDVKGARVVLTITSADMTCDVTVADAPTAARGFICK